MSSDNKPVLKLDWASHKAAAFACRRWHYTKSMPPPPHVRIGCWEHGRYIGCVLFSRGASAALAASFGLETTQVAELTRIALTKHETPVSRVLRIAIAMLRQRCPGVKLIVSFSDPEQGQHGGIYQASGWTFTGRTARSVFYRERKTGRLWHPRMVARHGTRRVFGRLRRVVRADDCDRVPVRGKLRYCLPLDAETRQSIVPMALPYPKRAKEAMAGPPAQRRCDPDPRAPISESSRASGSTARSTNW